MKIIPLRNADGQFSSRAIIETVLKSSPQKALSIDDFRMISKILDKLEGSEETLVLEDAEHAFLQNADDRFPWAVFNTELHQVREDIHGAAAAPPVALKALQK